MFEKTKNIQQILFLFIICLFSTSCNSEDAGNDSSLTTDIDRLPASVIETTNVSFIPEPESYYIEFHAYKESKPLGSPGHTFVEFWREQNGAPISYGKYGFYPDEGYTWEMFKNATPWEGKLQKESGDISIDITFKAKVSKGRFVKALDVKTAWENSSRVYIGGNRDCITFMLEVAEAAGLTATRCICFPLSNIEKLKEEN